MLCVSPCSFKCYFPPGWLFHWWFSQRDNIIGLMFFRFLMSLRFARANCGVNGLVAGDLRWHGAHSSHCNVAWYLSDTINLHQGHISRKRMTNRLPPVMMMSSNGTFFLRYWPFGRGIHWSPVNSPKKSSGTALWCFMCLNKRLSKQSWVW